MKPSPLSWVTPPGSAPGRSNWLDPDLVRSKLLAIGGILRHHEDIYFRNGLCEASDWMVVARERDVLVILHEPWQPYDRSKVKATFFAPLPFTKRLWLTRYRPTNTKLVSSFQVSRNSAANVSLLVSSVSS